MIGAVVLNNDKMVSIRCKKEVIEEMRKWGWSVVEILIIWKLKEHNINYKIEDSRLYALEEYTQDGVYGCRWIDVTNWSAKKMMYWLGY